MRVYDDISLRSFEFWGQAASNAEDLSYEELDQIEAILEADEPEEGYSSTYINDIFAYDFDEVLRWLGKVYVGDELYDESQVSDMDDYEIVEEYKDELFDQDYADIYRYVCYKYPEYENEYPDGISMVEDLNADALDEFFGKLQDADIAIIKDNGKYYQVVDLR